MVAVCWVYAKFHGRNLLQRCEKGGREKKELIRRIFTDHEKSQTADYLHELGYDKKYISILFSRVDTWKSLWSIRSPRFVVFNTVPNS